MKPPRRPRKDKDPEGDAVMLEWAAMLESLAEAALNEARYLRGNKRVELRTAALVYQTFAEAVAMDAYHYQETPFMVQQTKHIVDLVFGVGESRDMSVKPQNAQECLERFGRLAKQCPPLEIAYNKVFNQEANADIDTIRRYRRNLNNNILDARRAPVEKKDVPPKRRRFLQASIAFATGAALVPAGREIAHALEPNTETYLTARARALREAETHEKAMDLFDRHGIPYKEGSMEEWREHIEKEIAKKDNEYLRSSLTYALDAMVDYDRATLPLRQRQTRWSEVSSLLNVTTAFLAVASVMCAKIHMGQIYDAEEEKFAELDKQRQHMAGYALKAAFKAFEGFVPPPNPLAELGGGQGR